MLLAADVGGTKTLLGLFKQTPDRPAAIETGEFVTLDYDSLVPMIREFLKAQNVEARTINSTGKTTWRGIVDGGKSLCQLGHLEF